jgi:hypothetical protein
MTEKNSIMSLRDNYLIWWQGFHVSLTVCTVCIPKVMQFFNKPESILLFEPILKHTLWRFQLMHNLFGPHVRTKIPAMKTFKSTCFMEVEMLMLFQKELKLPPPCSFVETALEARNIQNYRPRIETRIVPHWFFLSRNFRC